MSLEVGLIGTTHFDGMVIYIFLGMLIVIPGEYGWPCYFSWGGHYFGKVSRGRYFRGPPGLGEKRVKRGLGRLGNTSPVWRIPFLGPSDRQRVPRGKGGSGFKGAMEAGGIYLII